MNSIADKIKKFFSDSKYIKTAVILGICGMLLIMLSEFLPENNEVSDSSEKVLSDMEYSTQDYTQKTEKRLKDILQQIDGVGKAEIMLTVNCTEEYVYAEEISSDIMKDGDRSSSGSENRYVFSGSSSDKNALVKKIITPQISGVVIVCEGGDKSSISEKVYLAVSTALDIPAGKIYVAGIK
jgi:stage III sporulation protein AG